MSLTFVFVTYQMLAPLMANIRRALDAQPSAKIIVIDNSGDDYAEKVRDALLAAHPDITYVRSDTNNRFHAYNLSLPLIKTDWVAFRTDDDVFDEPAIQALLSAANEYDYLYTNYTYENKNHDADGAERPLETFVFKTAVVRQHAPFGLLPSSDWKFLRDIFSSGYSSLYSPTICMHKKAHGR